jgi:hypothetical protein
VDDCRAAKSPNGIFCSRECRQKQGNFNCSLCGKECHRGVARLAPNASGKFYCSRVCKGKGETVDGTHRKPLVTPVTKPCVICGTLLTRPPSLMHRDPICSKACNAIFKSRRRGESHYKVKASPRQFVPCTQCGVDVERIPSQVTAYDKHFCGKACSGKWRSENIVRDKHPNWLGGRSFQIYTEAWNHKLCEAIRDRDGRRCLLCNMTELENGRKLDVHHVDYVKAHSTPDNLASLCHDCHLRTNFNRPAWKVWFQAKLIALYGVQQVERTNANASASAQDPMVRKQRVANGKDKLSSLPTVTLVM